MSAIIKFADHIPAGLLSRESLQEEFNNINSPDTPLEQKLASALPYHATPDANLRHAGKDGAIGEGCKYKRDAAAQRDVAGA